MHHSSNSTQVENEYNSLPLCIRCMHFTNCGEQLWPHTNDDLLSCGLNLYMHSFQLFMMSGIKLVSQIDILFRIQVQISSSKLSETNLVKKM